MGFFSVTIAISRCVAGSSTGNTFDDLCFAPTTGKTEHKQPQCFTPSGRIRREWLPVWSCFVDEECWLKGVE